MKTPTLIVLLGLCLAGPVFAAGTVTTDAQAQSQKLSATDIDTLVGPIALYPDALIGIILPASTNPTDIVLAARFLESGGAQEQIDAQNWEQSVRSLAHYPEVLKWMDDNLEWTQQLGVTFVLQPDDVMASIQRLRVRAQALGNLQTNEQLTIINEPEYIRIVPTYVERIYVPYYDPEVIYVSPFRWWFGSAWICGPWLRFDCNWVSRNIWFGTWAPSYFHRPAWRIIGNRPPPPHFVDRHTWRPDMRRWNARPHSPPPRPGNIVRPGNFSGWHRDRDGDHNRPGFAHGPDRGQPPRGRPANVTDRNPGSKRPPPPKAGVSQRTGRPGDDQARPPRQGQRPTGNPPAPGSSLTATPPSQGAAPAVRGSTQTRDGSQTRRPAVNTGAGQVRPEQRTTRGDNASRPNITRQPSGDRVPRTHTPSPSMNARPSQTSRPSGDTTRATSSQQPSSRATRTESSASDRSSGSGSRTSSSSESSGRSSGRSSSGSDTTTRSSGNTESRSSYQPPPSRSESSESRSSAPASRGDSGPSRSSGGGGRPQR